MQGKEYLDRMLDLLVDISKHCINKDKPLEDKSRCVDCALGWSLSICNYGCFYVNLLDNNDFIDDLKNACISSGVDYENRLNKLTEILVTECE